MAGQYADKVLWSRNIFTSASPDLTSGGVAVKGNKIMAVGSREEISPLCGPDTVSLDFGEKLIMPGFCDSHLHLKMGSVGTIICWLSEATSEEETALMLKEHYDNNKHLYNPGEWILGLDWYHFRWEGQVLPTAATLDKYFPDEPVFLFNGDCHGAWVNSKAMEIAGVTKDTPEVDHGKIYRFPDGTPTGYFEEGAVVFFTGLAFELNWSKEKMLMQNASRTLRELGITSVCDMLPLMGHNLGNLELLQDMADKGELDFRINFATELFADISESLSYKKKYNDKEGFLYYNGLKEFMDGIVTTYTGILKEPYTDKPDIPHVFEAMDMEEAEKKIVEAQKHGLNIHLHAVGDGAVHKALKMYEKALDTNGKTDTMFSIEHIDMSDPADHPLMKKVELVASVQPQHLTLSPSLETNDYPPVVGPEREKNLWAFKSLKDAGCTLAFGTDYPVVGPEPMKGLHRAVSRRFSDLQPREGWNPQEKLPLSDALIAYTLGGAIKTGKSDVIGTLEPGKLADIIVIDRNLFDVEPDEYLDASVIYTMSDGRPVYQK